ncbi:MAG: hypothetical protein V4671_18035 [Armatimonadota bacterium]
MTDESRRQTEATLSVTVTLQKGLAEYIADRAARSSQNESDIVNELLTDALVYVYGWPESRFQTPPSGIVRMANAILVQAIDSGADTVRIVPTQENLQVHLDRHGSPLPTAAENLTREIPPHLHKPLFNRYEHMAGPFGQRVLHPDAAETGMIPVIHSGKSYNVGLRFLTKESNAIGETLELTVEGPVETA